MNKKIKTKTQPPSNSKKTTAKHRWIYIFGGIFFIVMILAFYLSPLTNFHLLVYKFVPLPLGQSGGRLFTSYSLPVKSFSSQSNFVSGITNAASLTQLKSIARVHNVSVSQEDSKNALDELTQREAGGDSIKFNKILTDQYKSDPKEFRSFWLPLSLYNQSLEVWYNSQQSLNTEGFQTISSLQNKLKNGSDFSLLAKEYSQDESSSIFGGNVGKLYLSQVLPEFREKLSNASAGDLLVLPSRYGLHLIKVNSVQKFADSSKNDWLSLSQIFIKNKNFDVWLASEKNKYPINYWVNF